MGIRGFEDFAIIGFLVVRIVGGLDFPIVLDECWSLQIDLECRRGDCLEGGIVLTWCLVQELLPAAS